MADLAGINGSAVQYALATDLTATTNYTGAVVGSFSGSLTGLGHTISGLSIQSSANSVGLIGTIYGTVRDIGLVGGSVSGGTGIYVGGLVGNNSGTISNAYATGAVSGGSYVGGLVGYNGLYSGGIINTVWASGAVSGTGQDVGGLVGFNSNGSIANAYATGAVSGVDSVGGLVGQQAGGSIANAYATGAVSGSGNDVGGLVGQQADGPISNVYATGAVKGAKYVGGLVGYQPHGTISNAYATGAVSGGSYVGGLLGLNNGTISKAYATGAVSGGSNVGGLVGYNTGGITNGYWDTDTSSITDTTRGVGNVSSAPGVTGLTTAQFQDITNPGGLNLGSAFVGGAAGGQDGIYPYLKSFFPNGVQAVSGFAYKDAGVTPLASGGAGAVSVSVVGNGSSFGSATTGNNGYYYVFGPAGSIRQRPEPACLYDGERDDRRHQCGGNCHSDRRRQPAERRHLGQCHALGRAYFGDEL